MVGGRSRSWSGPATPRVAVVNQALARRDFPGASPVGRRYYLDDTTVATIVGVVTDIRNFGPYEAPRPEVYHSFRQDGDGWWSFSLMGTRIPCGPGM